MVKRVAILGGTGNMGRWFAKFYKRQGYWVIVSGHTPEKATRVAREINVEHTTSNIAAVQDVDIVVVATPIEVTAETIREVSSHLRRGTIIFDIASVKGSIMKALEEVRALGVRALSIHPLFGPGATTLRGKQIIMIPINEDFEVVREVARPFEDEGAVIHVAESGDEHDKMVALTLSLTHFLNILYGRILCKVNIGELKKFGGTTFALQLLVAESVLSHDPGLYYAIQSQNGFFIKLLDEFIDAAKENAQIIQSRDRWLFTKNFKEIRDTLSKDPDFISAYDKFYKVLEALT